MSQTPPVFAKLTLLFQVWKKIKNIKVSFFRFPLKWLKLFFPLSCRVIVATVFLQI